MRIDATLWGGIKGAGEAARELEDAGYDGAWTAETSHDPFLPLVQAARMAGGSFPGNGAWVPSLVEFFVDRLKVAQ